MLKRESTFTIPKSRIAPKEEEVIPIQAKKIMLHKQNTFKLGKPSMPLAEQLPDKPHASTFKKKVDWSSTNRLSLFNP